MTRLYHPTPEDLASWKAWIAERPDAVRRVAERLDPWTLYRLKTTNQYVTLASFFEDGTVMVAVTADFNNVLFERTVFGINPDDLEPAKAVPPPGLVLLSPEDVEANIHNLRCMVRPDLWEMGADGIAKRRAAP